MGIRALLPCRNCARHVFVDEEACPFCGARLERPAAAARALRAGGVAAALAAAACGGIAESQMDPAGYGGADAASAGPAGGGSTEAPADAAAGGGSNQAWRTDAAAIVLGDAAVRAPAGDAAAIDATENSGCSYWDMDPCSIYKSPPPLASV